MSLNFFYTMVQKSQKWPKTQIKGGGGGGPALNMHHAGIRQHSSFQKKPIFEQCALRQTCMNSKRNWRQSDCFELWGLISAVLELWHWTQEFTPSLDNKRTTKTMRSHVGKRTQYTKLHCVWKFLW